MDEEVEEEEEAPTEKEKEGAEQTETASEACAAESYMTMMEQQTAVGSGGGGGRGGRGVDACIQKNISFDGKPGTPTGWNGGFGEIFSLRDQLKQAEERAQQVQREVGAGTVRCNGERDTAVTVVGLLLFPWP